MSWGQPISSRLDARVRSNRAWYSRRMSSSGIRSNLKYPGVIRVARADTPQVARPPARSPRLLAWGVSHVVQALEEIHVIGQTVAPPGVESLLLAEVGDACQAEEQM